MPIDIKWIRNHAQQVQTWQQQRGRLNEEDQQRLVTRTVQLDQDCRQRLHHIRVLRESINKLSKQLRSAVVVTTTTTTNEEGEQQQQRRVVLVQERQDLQLSVTREESLYQEQQATLHKLVWRLASPIDNVITDTYPPLDNSNINPHLDIHPSFNNEEKDEEEMIVLDLSKNTGWRLAQAIMAVSINDFGSKYGQIHSLSSSKELFKSSTTTTTTTTSLSLQELDLFHAMWGCTSTTTGPSSCFLCTNPTATLQQQQEPYHSSPRPPPLLLESVPLWIPFMATTIPKKSIFGAKQLPQYTLLQDIGELDLQLVAITAGTTWDARQVQQQLAHELMTLYQQFVVVDNDNKSRRRPTDERIQLWGLAPTLLALHEQSRIVLSLRGRGGTTVILGWVSNYGDSAARACEWYFQGGGRHDTKDYVHVIHASIVSPHTIQHLLQANIHHDQKWIRIPPIVQQQQLCGGGSTSLQEEEVLVPEDSIPLEAVRSSSKDILAVPRRAAQPRNNDDYSNIVMMRKPRSIVFPQWEPRTIHPSGLGKKWKDAEALACPFGFLI